MGLNKTQIKNYFSGTIYKRGVAMKDNVIQITAYEEETDNGESIEVTSNINALVKSSTGAYAYQVDFSCFDDEVTYETLEFAECTCPYFYGDGCKHIVASILCYQDHIADARSKSKKSTSKSKKGSSKEKATSTLGVALLEQYTKNSVELVSGEHSLVPRFFNLRADYPEVALSVGKDKMYIVKRVDNFLRSVRGEEEVSYGKNLKFTHKISQFNESSQKLISLLDNFICSSGMSKWSSYSYVSYGNLSNTNRCVKFDGNSFALFFNLFAGRSIEIDGWDTKRVNLINDNPKLTMQVKKSGKGAELVLKNDEALYHFGSENQLYMLLGGNFYKCSIEFSKNVYPLLSLIDKKIFISEQDLPTLCSIVLPSIKDLVTVNDINDLCDKFTPDDCTPHFYFDSTEEDTIFAMLKFIYRDIEIDYPATSKQLTQIKQNVQSEEKAKHLLEEYFDSCSKGGIFGIKDTVDEDEFLTESINVFREYGEAFISSKLRNRFVDNKKKPTLGVSVSEGVLDLNIDTGEFPAEELIDLYDSFLKKNKFHKLKDGRLLMLENSGFEKVAEISHMLQLSPKELKKKSVKIPAYRSLYLDSVLDSTDNVSLKRNKDFRHMLKDFKSIEDSDFQPSDKLKATLFPYQVLGFQWLKTLEQYGFGGILADEMGLGKTIQVITYLLSIEQDKKKKLPSLIICPASLLFNWRDELQRFAPSIKVMLLLGNAKERQEQLSSKESKKADVWVTSYDLVKRDRELYEDKKFYSCILDEAQHIKNQTTLVSKTVKEINAKQRFVLTGTPIENRLSELWNLFDFIMPGYLFTHNAFVSKLEKPIVNSQEPLARKQLSLLVQPFIMRRLKKDVLSELPDKMEHVRKIHITEDERKIYLSAVMKIRSEVTEETNKIQMLALLTRLRQLCCDPNLCLEDYKGESSKLEACLELCQSMASNGHKILLFSQFTSMLDIIRERLTQLELSHLTIEGSTSKENRAKYVKEFQQGNTDVFLISLKAGGTGLNLTQADVVIHYDPWWNQAAQNQATDRAHRMGQENHVQVYKLITEGTIEEKILQLQEKKANLMESIFEETGDTPLSKDDILGLLEV